MTACSLSASKNNLIRRNLEKKQCQLLMSFLKIGEENAWKYNATVNRIGALMGDNTQPCDGSRGWGISVFFPTKPRQTRCGLMLMTHSSESRIYTLEDTDGQLLFFSIHFKKCVVSSSDQRFLWKLFTYFLKWHFGAKLLSKAAFHLVCKYFSLFSWVCQVSFTWKSMHISRKSRQLLTYS